MASVASPPTRRTPRGIRCCGVRHRQPQPRSATDATTWSEAHFATRNAARKQHGESVSPIYLLSSTDSQGDTVTEDAPNRGGEGPLPAGHWWAELCPVSPVSRTDITNLFAKASQARSKVEFRSFIEQLNGFAVELMKHQWGKNLFTVDGVRCMQAGEKEALGGADDHTGWARVLDVHGRFGDPLARYVAGYYPELHALRPRGFPDGVMKSIRDLARLNACTALRKAMLDGFGGDTTPLFESEDHANAVIAAILDGKAPDAEIHERYAILAYSNELRDYAARITDNPSKVAAKEPQLFESSVLAMASVIAARADELRAQHAQDLPSIEASTAIADQLLALVDAEIAATAREIKAIVLAAADEQSSGGTKLRWLEQRSQFFADARDSTRDELINLISRGHTKTEDDALSMFKGRVGNAVERDKVAHASAGTLEIGDSDGAVNPASPDMGPSMSSLLERLGKTVIEYRDEIPGGFGRRGADEDTAEFDLTVSLLDQGITEPAEVQRHCKQRWSSYEGSAIGASPKALADNVVSTIRWAAIRSGLKR